jgi:hypothetical protein
MQLTWRDAVEVQLVAGYCLEDARGRTVDAVLEAKVACEGGFLHIALPDMTTVQVVSAPAVRRVVLRGGGPDAG